MLVALKTMPHAGKNLEKAMPMSEQLICVNGIELSVHIAGPEDGRPIWLLHGFPECWHSWREQIPALAAAGYRVFAPEMRGYGQSGSPAEIADYDLLTLCGDIQQAMDHLAMRRWSWSAMTGARSWPGTWRCSNLNGSRA